jgi:hypothetical protein
MKLARRLPLVGLLGLGACQTAPHAPSGFLGSYDGLAAPGQSLRAAVSQRREEPALEKLERVYLAPAVLVGQGGQRVSEKDRETVLREVDRQICYAVSRRFTVVGAPAPDAGVIRTAVVEIRPTGRVGSAAAAVVGFFNPVPLTDIRVPLTTGGLAVESELVAPDGRQIAVVTWARNANVIGRDNPSLSRVGDALQMTKPMGAAVTKAFAPRGRNKRPVDEPDPCAEFGPRSDKGRWVAGKVAGQLTGLYSPTIDGLAEPARDKTLAGPR